MSIDTGCYKSNPLRRGGTSREQRTLAALLPGYVRMDERRIEDLILFANEYAKLIVYYDAGNKPAGDWKDFFTSDISTILAKIAATHSTLVRETYKKYLEILEADKSPENFKPLFSIIFSLFLEIDGMNDPGILETSFKEDLNNEIKGRLRKDLQQLAVYYKSRETAELLGTDAAAEAGDDDSYPFKDAGFVINRGFSDPWITVDNGGSNSWGSYYDGITVDSTIYQGADAESNIDYSLSFITAIFNRTYAAYVRIINNAGRHLDGSLTGYPAHKAHNALMLTFFKIFLYHLEELNQLTERHLRFYFKEVLRLKEKSAVPDSVHVLVQLAKHKDSHLIKAGTQLKAGKDGTGKDLIYETAGELVANKAEIAEVKTIFIDTDDNCRGIYDAPAANSLHGLGEEDLDPLKPYWRTFGQPQKGLEEDKTTMRHSGIGFAIASPVLRLKQGIRRITFKLFIEQWGSNSTLSERSLVNALEVTFSGEKEWIKGGDFSSYDDNPKAPNYIRIEDSNTQHKLLIKVTLGEDASPVKDFDPENLDGGFDTPWPVARFRIKKDVSKNVYKLLRDIKIKQIGIIVKVDHFQDLVLANDHGPLDPAKPFLPFGPRPKKWNTFYIGSHEAFSKKLNYIRFYIHWMGLPDCDFMTHYSYKDQKGTNVENKYLKVSNNSDFKARVSILNNGKWESVKDRTQIYLFHDKEGSIPSKLKLEFADSVYKEANNETPSGIKDIQELLFSTTPSADPYLEPFNSFDLNIKRGFLKLELSEPKHAFGHDLFSHAYSSQVISMNLNGPGDATLPKEPYTPAIKCFQCHYEATSDLGFNDSYDKSNGQFFHIHPFGYKEVQETGFVNLVPPFVHQRKDKQTNVEIAEDIRGALYIGIEGSKPDQIVSILFQAAEGTEDFSKDRPEVVWSFLAENQWQSLEDFIVSDSTNSLLGTGIIRFKIPKTANTDNSFLTKGLRWLRASIGDTYDAFPQMMEIKAQALKATFKDMENDPNHLALPLPGNTITKMVKSDSAVKKISQPYESFDGRMQEQPALFYNRVSERLRHKNRAITIWDYERLVLEEFPFIYKVKCLNHTNTLKEFIPTEMDPTEKPSEIAPGFVRIVVVPDMRNKKAGNRFEPAVSSNNRTKIKQYLETLNCNFVNLEVENPVYEAIRVHCEVAFHKEFDPLYYQTQLAEDISKFLAPWAYEEGRTIEFGGSLEQSVIVKFTEDLPYVDFVTDFWLDLYIQDNKEQEKVSSISASTSRSILTSYKVHDIKPHECDGST